MPQPNLDFLGIGAPRAGTTWLWRILEYHPDIWMPPRKELHYFDRSPRYPSPSYLAGDTFAQRMFGLQPANKQFRTKLLRSISKVLLLRSNPSEIQWNIRYLFFTINDRWYRSLFAQAAPKSVKGEITPAYCLLDAPDVQHIQALFPDLKVIYLLRNPVDRAWSDLRYDWTMGKFQKMGQPEALRTTTRLLAKAPRGNYLHTLQTWQTIFPKNNIFIGFFDDILARPGDLSQSLFSFLGVEGGVTLPPQLLHAQINPARTKPMPSEVRRTLSQSYLPQVEILNDMFPGGYPAYWLAEIKTALA